MACTAVQCSHLSSQMSPSRFSLLLTCNSNMRVYASPRAYAMSDADFAGQDWQDWAAGRKSHFVQVLI